MNGQERSDFTVSASYDNGVSSNARVIMATGVTGQVRIVGDRDPRRQNRFGFGPIAPRDLNLAFDTIEGEMQEARRDINLSVRSAYGGTGYTISGNIPDGATLMKQGDMLVEGPDIQAIADVVEGWASDIVSQGAVPIFSSASALSTIPIPLAMNAIRINGKLVAGDGKGGLFVDVNNGSSETFVSGDGRTWYRVKDVGVERVAASVESRIIEFDIRDSRFAGGAKWNDIDNDDAAFAAAIAYFKTLGGLNQFQGKNAARLRLPRGMGRIGVNSVDLTGASNVHLIGEGDGVSNVRLIGNFPAFKTTTVAGNDDFRIGIADLCIYGPGRANVNAHGIDFGALNNGFIRDVRFYALRDAIRLRNNWQTDVTRPKIDGGPTVGGGLTCYRGICLLDGLTAGGGSNTVLENAVKVTGGIISGCETVGFRGESVSGSVVIGLEILACGQTGMLVGDNPGGKAVKWFSVIGCLLDTGGDLLALIKGASSELTQMHFSGLWLGYANAGSGNGDACRIENGSKITIRPDVVANVDTALVAKNCSGITYQAGIIDGYDRSLVGSTGIILENTQLSFVSAGRANKWTGSPSALFLAETGTSDQNILDGINADNSMTVIGAATVVNACRPFKARNRGAVDIASGQSSVVVSHGLGRAPTRGEIQVTPRHSLASVGVNSFFVEADTTPTTFTIRVNAATTGGIGFDWFGDVSRG